MRETAVCGCKPSLRDFTKIEHSKQCRDRGWSEMTRDEVEADRKKIALEEMREEAKDKVGEVRDKIDQYAILGQAGLDILKAARPTLADMAAAFAQELRGVFGNDLMPLLEALEAAGKWAVETSANTRADMVKALMARTDLSEATCLAIVLSSSQVLDASIKSAFDRDKMNGKKK